MPREVPSSVSQPCIHPANPLIDGQQARDVGSHLHHLGSKVGDRTHCHPQTTLQLDDPPPISVRQHLRSPRGCRASAPARGARTKQHCRKRKAPAAQQHSQAASQLSQIAAGVSRLALEADGRTAKLLSRNGYGKTNMCLCSWGLAASCSVHQQQQQQELSNEGAAIEREMASQDVTAAIERTMASKL